ncbi:NAD-dependent epimerase/dehydratase family protein [soil metagenome]
MGATGFLGRVVVPRLVDGGATVTAHGRTPTPFTSDIDYVRGDLVDPDQAEGVLAPWRWDAVVNLAGPVTGGTEDWATGVSVTHAHVMIALNLRRFASPHTRIVHTSSMTVYGDPQAERITEDHPRVPRHLYGLAKARAEDVWLSAPDIDAWVLRMPGLFSEQRRSGALFQFCRAARNGESVRVTATAPVPWDLLHVDDAADAIVRALSARPPGGAINVSYGDPVELVAIAQWIAELAGTGSRVESPADVTHPVVQLAVTRARERLGWQPPRLHDRLAALYAAYAQEPV